MTSQDIDVRKCDYYSRHNGCTISHDLRYQINAPCKDYPNCCYKQREAKERELIEFQTKYVNEINDRDCTIAGLEEQIQKYKEALEEIANINLGCWSIPHNCEKCLSCVELGQDLRPYMIAKQALED